MRKLSKIFQITNAIQATGASLIITLSLSGYSSANPLENIVSPIHNNLDNEMSDLLISPVTNSIPPMIDNLLPNLGSDLLSSLDIENLIRGFRDVINQIFSNNTIEEIFALFNDNFDCNDTTLTQGVMIFVPIEPGWCEVLPNGETIGEILDNNQGVLNIPIPSQVQEEIRRAISESNSNSSSDLPEITDPFQTNSLVQANLNSNAADRSQTQVAIESVLGESGQQEIREQLRSTETDLAEIALQANVALRSTATQDVMKNIAKILARDSVISATISSELTKLRIDSQYSNINLSNVSRTLDQSLRRQLVNDSINQSRLFYLNSRASLW